MALSVVGRKLLVAHGTQKRLAKRLDVTESEVSLAIADLERPVTEKGWKRRNRIQRAVAKAIGLSVEEAFGAEERGVQSQETVAA